jgi:hypothetical protein
MKVPVLSCTHTPYNVILVISLLSLIYSCLSVRFPQVQRLALEPAAFILFSIGPASCPGKMLALMEMRMVISVIVSRFD